MTDEEYIKHQFEWDCIEKKRIAQGKKHRVKSKRGMKTPSEYLSKKERDKLNGEVKTYNLNRPMDYKEFKGLPEDLQKAYIESLQERFGVGNTELAAMFGCSANHITKIRKRLNAPAPVQHGRNPKKRLDLWEKWLAGDTKTMTQMELDKRFRTEPYVPDFKERILPSTAVVAALGNRTPEEAQELIDSLDKASMPHSAASAPYEAAAKEELTRAVFNGETNIAPGDYAEGYARIVSADIEREKLNTLLELLKKLENSHAKITIELTL